MGPPRAFVATYIMASEPNGFLYVGMTADLPRRVQEHKAGDVDGYACEHGCTNLVWFERHMRVVDAIAREKRLKKWKRAWKVALIEAANPQWRDLAADWPDQRG